jgi:hypothetical protein
MIRPQVLADESAERLRRAIARRDAFPPGTRRHWLATCEVRAIQNGLVGTGLAWASVAGTEGHDLPVAPDTGLVTPTPSGESGSH